MIIRLDSSCYRLWLWCICVHDQLFHLEWLCTCFHPRWYWRNAWENCTNDHEKMLWGDWRPSIYFDHNSSESCDDHLFLYQELKAASNTTDSASVKDNTMSPMEQPATVPTAKPNTNVAGTMNRQRFSVVVPIKNKHGLPLLRMSDVAVANFWA